MNSADIILEAARLRQENRAFSIATIVSTKGSVPRKSGTKMLVLEDGTTIGTIGGGVFEKWVKGLCLKALSSQQCVFDEFTFETKAGDMACGGTIAVFIEPVLSRVRLFILGSGHVAQALGKLALFCNKLVIILDKQIRHLQEDTLLKACKKVEIADFKHVFTQEIPHKNDMVVIATGTHEDDYIALKQTLLTDVGFIGLLGSRKKWALFSKRLPDDGIPKKDLERVFCPVGLDIGAQGPEEIAVSIVAQLIKKIRNFSA